jgi:hypothetical protein
MKGIYCRTLELGTRTFRGMAGWRVPGDRVRVAAAVTTATVLVVGAGVVWGLAGADGRQADASGTPLPSADPGASSDEVFGDDPDALGSPGSLGAAGDPTGAGGLSSGEGSGSGSGGNGRPPGNRPPVIEDPGLSSDGMTLTIAPKVTDPDGDAFTVGYAVDGTEVTAVSQELTYRFFVDDVGYRHEAQVTITATDEHGATTEDTFTETLTAVTTVTFGIFEFSVVNPEQCFAKAEAWRLTGFLQLSGAVKATTNINEELRRGRSRITLLDDRPSAQVVGAQPTARVIFAGGEIRDANGKLDSRGSLSNVHQDSEAVRQLVFEGGACRGELRYLVTFQTR